MDLLKKYDYTPSEEDIASGLEVIASGLDSIASKEVFLKCFSFMDITTLHNNDTVASVTKFVGKVNTLESAFPDYPKPASICVFPNYVGTVCSVRKSPSVHATAAASCFPTTQTFNEVKVLECEMAVNAGADEIDVILPLESFLGGDIQRAYEEICTMKAAIDAAAVGRKVIFKVILETGLLVTPERIAEASFLAMEAGADFIKTSTGKVDVNATPMAAFVMCECIRRYHEVTGRRVGFKAAGGISTAKDALCYYCIVSTVLGPLWLTPSLFRLGVSRLGNSLMSAIEQKTVSFF